MEQQEDLGSLWPIMKPVFGRTSAQLEEAVAKKKTDLVPGEGEEN